jgi:tRNA(fMet)-specific endonuclease VapC
MLRYLLDTNVCVDYLNGRYENVIRAIQTASVEELCTSSIVAAELRYGADKSRHPQRNHARLDVLLAELRPVVFGVDAARCFGKVRSRLEARGLPIGPYDMQIAAHALSLDVTLVTDNLAEFRRVRGLRVESWR